MLLKLQSQVRSPTSGPPPRARQVAPFYHNRPAMSNRCFGLWRRPECAGACCGERLTGSIRRYMQGDRHLAVVSCHNLACQGRRELFGTEGATGYSCRLDRKGLVVHTMRQLYLHHNQILCQRDPSSGLQNVRPELDRNKLRGRVSPSVSASRPRQTS